MQILITTSIERHRKHGCKSAVLRTVGSMILTAFLLISCQARHVFSLVCDDNPPIVRDCDRPQQLVSENVANVFYLGTQTDLIWKCDSRKIQISARGVLPKLLKARELGGLSAGMFIESRASDDPETQLVMQLADDNSCERRQVGNLLCPESHYIVSVDPLIVVVAKRPIWSYDIGEIGGALIVYNCDNRIITDTTVPQAGAQEMLLKYNDVLLPNGYVATSLFPACDVLTVYSPDLPIVSARISNTGRRRVLIDTSEIRLCGSIIEENWVFKQCDD